MENIELNSVPLFPSGALTGLIIGSDEVTSITVPEQWVCTPHLRRLGWDEQLTCYGGEKLQQLWTESWSGKQEWRDVPLVTE